MEKEKKEKTKTNKIKASKVAKEAVETVIRRVGCEVEIEMVANPYDDSGPSGPAPFHLQVAHRLFVDNMSEDGTGTIRLHFSDNLLNREHYGAAIANTIGHTGFEDYWEREKAALGGDEFAGIGRTRFSPSLIKVKVGAVEADEGMHDDGGGGGGGDGGGGGGSSGSSAIESARIHEVSGLSLEMVALLRRFDAKKPLTCKCLSDAGCATGQC